jgi:hypothetical protein
LEKAAVFAHKDLQNQLFFRPKTLVKRILGLPLDGILKLLKLHPSALRFWWVLGKKGNLIRMVRKNTGI